MQITKLQLKLIAPHASETALEIYPALFNEILPKYGINTKSRLSFFLSQVLHESGSLRYTEEIASGRAYEGREDLGNVFQGDGVRFKGRGLIQVTGRTNYRACSFYLFKDNRLLDKPELLEYPRHALESACWFWNSRNLSDIADKPTDWTYVNKGKTFTRITWISYRVNGGFNGLTERIAFYNRAVKVLK